MRSERPVLLLNPNRMQPPVTPVALDYLAQCLERDGFAVEVLDLAFSQEPEADIRNALARMDPLLIGVTVRNLDDSYLASQDFCLERTRDLVSLVRSLSGAQLILGGVGFSISPEAALDYCGAEMGVRGEGEETLPALAGRIARGRPFDDLPGLIWKQGSSWWRNPVRYARLEELDLSRREAVDNRRYFQEGGMVGFESKRGCPGGCTYCADPVAKGAEVRPRNPAQVARELENLYRQGIDHFHTCDSEFNLPESHALEVCQEIVKRGLGEKIRWYAYLSPLPFSRELARWMRRAGCVGIDFGVDHGSPEMLQALGRPHTPQDILEVARLAKGEGFSLLFDLLLGGPGETRATLEEAIDLMKQASPDLVGISLGVRLYPETSLFRLLERRGETASRDDLQGAVEGNPGLLRPVFYLSSALGSDPESYLEDLIGGDERFLFGNPKREGQNYNYNDHSLLREAIAKGYRGAFWDILRRIRREGRSVRDPGVSRGPVAE